MKPFWRVSTIGLVFGGTELAQDATVRGGASGRWATSVSGSAQGSVLTSKTGDVELDRGTRLLLVSRSAGNASSTGSSGRAGFGVAVAVSAAPFKDALAAQAPDIIVGTLQKPFTPESPLQLLKSAKAATQPLLKARCVPR